MLQIARAPCYGDRDLAGQVMSIHGNPMYHALGFVLTTFAVRVSPCVYTNQTLIQIFFAQITSGVCIGLPAPRQPPPSLTAESAIRGAMATHAKIVLAVPSMVEVCMRSPLRTFNHTLGHRAGPAIRTTLSGSHNVIVSCVLRSGFLETYS